MRRAGSVRWFTLIGLCSAGCGPAGQDPVLEETGDIELPERIEPLQGVTITHLSEALWQVDYRLNREVTGIWVSPPTADYHADTWSLPDDFHLTVHPGSGLLAIERVDEAPFDSLTLTMETHGDIVPYAPQPFGVFSSGTAVNTMTLGFYKELPSGEAKPFRPKYTFRPLPEEQVLIPGGEEQGIEQVELPEEGAFIFFGSTEDMLATDRVRMLLDSDAPAGLSEDLFATVVSLDERYTSELGEPSESPLTILLSWELNSWGVGGNAQGSQIYGQLWGTSTPSSDEIRDYESFLAHEMAHVWQAEVSGSWYLEGSAELLRSRALIDLGIDTEAVLLAQLNENVAHSLANLHRSSLIDAFSGPVPELSYTAGMLLMVAAESATGMDGTPQTIYDIEREMMQRSAAERLQNPVGAWVSVVESLGATESAGAALEAFLVRRHADPLQALTELFDATGVDYEVRDDGLVLQ